MDVEKRESELGTGNIEEWRGCVQDILYERRIKKVKKNYVGSISFYPIRVQSSPLEHGKRTWF